MAREKISAIVCTRNRSAYLAKALAAFEKQTLSPRLYEVIVIDNGSTDETAAVCETFTARNDNFRCFREERAGLATARNRGVRESAAGIVAFTDDDAEPEPAWLERIVNAFESLPRDTGIVGGDVLPIWESPRPDWLLDYLLRPLSAGLKWSDQPKFLRNAEWLVEVNSAYLKSALLQVEGFPEQLGRVGEMLLSGEGAVNILIERAGFRIYYDPHILVRHHIPTARMTRNWFRRRSFWQGVSLSLLRRYIDETSRRLGLTDGERRSLRDWEEIPVPVTPAAWADLFDDRRKDGLDDQLYRLEQLGYLLESQGVVVGR